MTFIYFQWGISKYSVSLFLSIYIISIVIGFILPSKFPFCFKFSIFPWANVITSIWKCDLTKSIRDESINIYLSLILSSILISNPCFLLRISVKSHNIWIIWVSMVINSQSSCRWNRFFIENTLKFKQILMTHSLTVTLNPTKV